MDILRNILALVATFAVSFVWLRICNYLANRGLISAATSRKLIHIGTGPLFCLCWLLFDNSYTARYLAALVPLLITAQFALIGAGVIRDAKTVNSMARTGDRSELLKGPLFYGIVFVILTIVYWDDSPIGITALMLLCGGDGLAEISGIRWKTVKLPWSKTKSAAGSIAMFAGSVVFTMALLGAFVLAGKFQGGLAGLLLPVTLISLAGTAVESLPVLDIDNLTIPAIAVLLGHLLF